MLLRNRRRPAFTLVEILIVVIILGILAAIVVPSVADASTKAKVSATQVALRAIRQQLLNYQTQHNQTLPTLAQLQANWGVLTSKTDTTGAIGHGDLGPYLAEPPVNPFTNSSTVVAAGGGTTQAGWEYDATTGTLGAVGFNETTATYTAPVVVQKDSPTGGGRKTLPVSPMQ